MSHLRRIEWALALGAVVVFVGCQGAPPRDDSVFLAHQPRSILVLPPLDRTLEPAASYGALETITRPLAEQGYYVFPVALVDAMMRENGLPTPDEMHAVPLPKLAEIFAPDAVLYLTVHEWGTSYQVVNSATTVTLEGRLVDADTGLDLWAGRATAVKSSGNGGGGLAGLLADALVTQISSSVYDPTPEVARVATDRLLVDPSVGLLIGPRHPEFGEAKR